MSLVCKSLDLETIVIRGGFTIRLVALYEDFNWISCRLVCLDKQQLKLLLVILEAADEVQVLRPIEYSQHFGELDVVGARLES